MNEDAARHEAKPSAKPKLILVPGPATITGVVSPRRRLSMKGRRKMTKGPGQHYQREDQSTRRTRTLRANAKKR